MQMNMNLKTNQKTNLVLNISFWAQMTHTDHSIFTNKSVPAEKYLKTFLCVRARILLRILGDSWFKINKIWFYERKIVNYKQFS